MCRRDLLSLVAYWFGIYVLVKLSIYMLRGKVGIGVIFSTVEKDHAYILDK